LLKKKHFNKYKNIYKKLHKKIGMITTFYNVFSVKDNVREKTKMSLMFLLKYRKNVNVSSAFLKTRFFLKRSTKPFKQNFNALKRFF